MNSSGTNGWQINIGSGNAPNHYLSQCRPCYLTPQAVIRGKWVQWCQLSRNEVRYALFHTFVLRQHVKTKTECIRCDMSHITLELYNCDKDHDNPCPLHIHILYSHNIKCSLYLRMDIIKETTSYSFCCYNSVMPQSPWWIINYLSLPSFMFTLRK